jgi:hypothetical protein
MIRASSLANWPDQRLTNTVRRRSCSKKKPATHRGGGHRGRPKVPAGGKVWRSVVGIRETLISVRRSLLV